MAQKLQQQLKEVGSKLETPPASKDAVIKLLKQAALCLCEVEQSPPKPMTESLQPLVNAIIRPELLKHQDREVKLFVVSCICEITRITAPEAPYEDDVLKDIFQLIVSTFSGLNDVNGPSFGRRVVILETLARYRSCVVMLDIECDDLIEEMFNTFFSVARDELPGNVLTSMQTIMEVILEESEDVPENLLLILLTVLGCDKKGVTDAAKRLALNVIESCASKLETSIRQFLVSSMSGDSRPLKCKIDYHAVLYDIYRYAPQILSGVVPYLTGELLSDQLEIRMKAVGLVGDLFALPGSTISEAFKPVFLEFLKRLADRAVEVRMAVLEYVKTCLLENPFRSEAHQMISALCDRLLDYDENVRKQVVSVVCDVACHALTSIPVENIKLVSERLRDKSHLVKRYTMERLAEIYRTSCMEQACGSEKDNEYGWIVGKILKGFYDKDFRSDTIEPILSLSLFPADFSVRDKVKRWVRIFSGFDKIEVTALEKILEQKQRLQQEMQKYLSLRQLSHQEGDDTEIQKKVVYCFRVMSRFFSDPAKAQENFQVLDQLKDSIIWKRLAQLLDPNTSSAEASSLRGDLLKLLGQKHRLYGFLTNLSLKCSYLLFDKEHVRETLIEAGIQKSSESSELLLSCMTVLVILARICPSLLGGIEEDLVHLLEDDNEIMKEGTLHILAKAGGTFREQLGVSSRSLDLILERICIEGSRRQAKYAVYALASITKDDGLMALSVLYKRLVDMLEEKSHLPAVLQSLGCIAQAALPVFETREIEVEKFIKEKILELGQITGDGSTCWDDRSELCSLKIFGLKALVKSYSSAKDPNLPSRIDDLIGILKNILLFGDMSREIESSLVDKAHLKLAAAKAVLRLLKKWENRIPVDILYLALRTSEDKFPEVQKLLLNKVHQYVRDHILDPKFACGFLLDISSQSDFEENKRYLNDIFQMCRQGRRRQISLQTDAVSPPLYPEFILPYVVHSLAHHPSFPNVDECKDAKTFEPMYRQLYFFLSMLVHGDADGKSDVSMSKDKESIRLLHSIFQSIKCSEDAFDKAASKNSYALCDLGASIIKRLAANQDELQESVPVALPPVLYKALEKKDENDLLVNVAKTWLADEENLAYFGSLKLEANGIDQSVTSEDDIMKDSETEGSEMPLGKLLKRLKAKAAKTKKEVKNEHAQAGVANEDDFNILKMVKEINSDNQGAKRKFESSNGHGFDGKNRRSGHGTQKNKTLISDSTDLPMPKRRRTSAQTYKSRGVFSSKGSKRRTNVNNNIDFEKLHEDPQTSSEDQSTHEKTGEPAESELLSSHVKKRPISSSKQKGKRADRDPALLLTDSQEAKKPKKVSSTDSPRSMSFSKLGSQKKQNHKSITGLEKCTTKDKGSSTADLIGCRIKVWWPMDKKYYEGVVKSFDTEKNKHVILYEDGDVEVLRLDRERWEVVDNGLKAKRSGSSSKGFSPKGGSSSKRRKSGGSSKQGKKLGEKSPFQDRRKITQRGVLKGRSKIMSKSESLEESDEILDVASPEISTKSLVDDSGSENEQTETTGNALDTEDLSEENKQEDVENVLSDNEEPKEREEDSEETETDNLVEPSHDPHGSDNEEVSSSDKQQPNETDEEAEEDADEPDVTDRHAKVSKKLNKKSPGTDRRAKTSTKLDKKSSGTDRRAKTSKKLDKKSSGTDRRAKTSKKLDKKSASNSSDTDLSEDEPLFLWKQRSQRK